MTAITLPEGTSELPERLDERPDVQRRADYQKARLRCGVVGIGLVLGVSAAALVLGLPGQLDAAFAGYPGVLAGALAGVALGLLAAGVQLPVDLAAVAIEKRFGQRPADDGCATPSGSADCPCAVRTYAIHLGQWLLGLTTAGAAVGLVVSLAPMTWPLWVSVALVGIAGFHVLIPLAPTATIRPPDSQADWLEQTQAELASLGLRWPRVRWFDHGERSLAGGWNGIGPGRTLFLARSLWTVRPRIAAGLIARELGHDKLGHRAYCMLASVLHVVMGVKLAASTVQAVGPLGPAGVVTVVACVMTAWCFAGLFFWPAVGRRQVLAADKFAADAGLSKSEQAELFATLADRNLPDEKLGPTKAYVFHPIPALATRRRALGLD